MCRTVTMWLSGPGCCTLEKDDATGQAECLKCPILSYHLLNRAGQGVRSPADSL